LTKPDGQEEGYGCHEKEMDLLGGKPKIRKELEGLVKYGINFFFFIVASKLRVKAITE
jgi:hypothetical protein